MPCNIYRNNLVSSSALLFAWCPSQVKELAETALRNPVLLSVGTDNAGAADIDQRLVYVGREEGKLLAMRQLVQEGLRPPVLVFLQSKDRAKVTQRPCLANGNQLQCLIRNE